MLHAVSEFCACEMHPPERKPGQGWYSEMSKSKGIHVIWTRIQIGPQLYWNGNPDRENCRTREPVMGTSLDWTQSSWELYTILCGLHCWQPLFLKMLWNLMQIQIQFSLDLDLKGDTILRPPTRSCTCPLHWGRSPAPPETKVSGYKLRHAHKKKWRTYPLDASLLPGRGTESENGGCHKDLSFLGRSSLEFHALSKQGNRMQNNREATICFWIYLGNVTLFMRPYAGHISIEGCTTE